MNEPAANAIRTLRSLIALLDREAREIRKRDFNAIALLTREKTALAAAFDSLAAGLARSAFDDTFQKYLETVAIKAEENADQLRLLQTGLADARRRLEGLIEEGRRTGIYAPGGDAIRRAAPARMEREA